MTQQQRSTAARVSAGGGRKRLGPFNRFMQEELARLKEAHPDMPHQERFKMASANWSAKR